MKQSTDSRIDRLTEAIERLVAKEVLPVAPVAPVLPIIPQHSGDHDLLTRLDVKVDKIQEDVTELKKQTTYYVTQEAHGEVVRIQADHEARIRTNETYIRYGLGALALLNILGIVIGIYAALKK